MINGSLFTFNQVFNGWMFKLSFMMMGVFKFRSPLSEIRSYILIILCYELIVLLFVFGLPT
jgi:hypothetical protein